jgi:branched-chain amino acid transport system permease protein
VHFCVNPDEDPHVRAFGIPFNAASPVTWIVTAVLLIGGFLIARRTWARVGQSWDDASAAAREKAVAA